MNSIIISKINFTYLRIHYKFVCSFFQSKNKNYFLLHIIYNYNICQKKSKL